MNMNFEKLKIDLSINDLEYKFYYSCNQNATFSDLLEYFSFLVPYLNICKCYQFLASKDKKSSDEKFFKIPHQSKIEEFKNFLNNIIIVKDQDICIHNKLNMLLSSKNDIIYYYEKIISQKNKEIEQYKKRIDLIEDELHKIPVIKTPINGKPINFYDLIIHIDSVKDINKGWKIDMNEKGKLNYEKYRNENILKLGVIGNANKGKSHLLSKISKIKLPSGMSIKTEGLSIKYPDLKTEKNRKIVLLDSAGLETPVLVSELDSMGKYKNGAKERNELFKEKSREKLITELFLQNYIVNNSDILLVVVDCLSFSEQKLLMKIKKERERANKNSKLYVIHNLKAYTSIIQVKDYINKTLLNSATFKLVMGNMDPKEDGIFFYEIPNEKKVQNESNIYHLIYANEYSEAGKYYNNFTLKFIEQSYKYINNFGNYDVILTIKERFIEKYEEIVEKGEKLTMNSFENSNPNLIKLKNEKEIILKQCFIDELGFSNLKPNGFEPKYNIFEENNKIIVRAEIPGHTIIQSDIVDGGHYNIIKLTGQKIKDLKPEKLEDNIHNFRDYGDFSLEIPISKDYIFSREHPFYRHIDGLHIFEYKLYKEEGPFHPKIENIIDY